VSDRALYPATSAAERISFRQVNQRTGNRLRHKFVDSVTGEAVDSSNKARGYEVGENQFLLVEDSDLERARSERPPPGAMELAEPPRRESPPTVPARLHEPAAEETADVDDEDDEEEIAAVPPPQNTRTIEIERFLPAGQIDARYFEKPYYIVPREEIGQESFAVRRRASANAPAEARQCKTARTAFGPGAKSRMKVPPWLSRRIFTNLSPGNCGSGRAFWCGSKSVWLREPKPPFR
jgi:hypothetical protein